MNHFGDRAAILNSTVSNSYYVMMRGGHTHTNLFSEHPIVAICNKIIQNGRRTAEKGQLTPVTFLSYIFGDLQHDVNTR